MVDTQNTIFVLQQRMAALEKTNTMLLERIDELETNVDVLEMDVETCYQQIDELRIASNATNQELEDLDGIVESHDADIEGIGFSSHIPNMKMVENLSLVVLDCTFTMY